MKCADVQQVLPELLDGTPDSAFQSEFGLHLQSCPDCSDLVSDLKLIAIEARQLEQTDEPPARVWVRIAAELRVEGLIHDQQPSVARPILVATPPPRRRIGLWLAPVAAVIIAVGSFVIGHKSAAPVAHLPVSTAPATVAKLDPKVPVSPQQETVPALPGSGSKASSPATVEDRVNVHPSAPIQSAPAATDDQQFLSEVSTLAPSMRTTYEGQLKAVNADIAESQAYLDQNPGDVDARQHLMDAYQQKALLYQIALDRIQ